MTLFLLAFVFVVFVAYLKYSLRRANDENTLKAAQEIYDTVTDGIPK